MVTAAQRRVREAFARMARSGKLRKGASLSRSRASRPEARKEGKKMARFKRRKGRRYGGRRGRKGTRSRPKPSITGILCVAVPVIGAMVEAKKESGNDMARFARNFSYNIVGAYTGLDIRDGKSVRFDGARLAQGWGPILAKKAISAAKRASGFRTPRAFPVTL